MELIAHSHATAPATRANPTYAHRRWRLWERRAAEATQPVPTAMAREPSSGSTRPANMSTTPAIQTRRDQACWDNENLLGTQPVSSGVPNSSR
jgi:hypothetical protein